MTNRGFDFKRCARTALATLVLGMPLYSLSSSSDINSQSSMLEQTASAATSKTQKKQTVKQKPTQKYHTQTKPAQTQPAIQKQRKLIAIDPGHGMSNSQSNVYDPGAVRDGVEEATINLRVAAYLGQDLINRGYDVVLTRLDDETPCPITKRNKFSDADLFVSLHCNSSKSEETKATGVRVFYSPKRQSDKTFAANIEDALSQTLTEGVQGYSEKNKAVYEGNFLVLNTSRVPAALVEMGYMNNSFDRAYLQEAEKLIARGIANGLDKQLKTK